MALQRKTSVVLPVPADNTPIPAPKLIFGTQSKNTSFPTGGLFSRGTIKFNLNNIPVIELAKAAFVENSSYKDDSNALNAFLLSLSITSKFEAGFDGANTYDKAGISIGFIQFARPEGGVGQLFNLIGRPDLVTKIKNSFGITDPHDSAGALLARFDQSLLKELVTVAASSSGIKAQLAMAINKNVAGQFYFEKAYAKALELELNDLLCVAMLFDAAVNMGAGSVSKFKAPMDGQTNGDWLQANCNLFTRPERKTGWQTIVKENFA